MSENDLQWQMPPFEASDETKLGFIKRCVDLGITWFRDSNRTMNMRRAMDLLAGKTGGKVSTKWANFTTGDLKRGVSEIVETLSDIRPSWGYSSENKAFLPECNMASKVAKAIYMESFVDRAVRDALQFASISGAGFIYPYFSRSKFGMGEGEFVFMALGQPDVLPIQLPRGRNYQNAYIVTLVIPMGVAEAHARFPEYQRFLKPFGEKTYARTPSGNSERAYDQNRWKMHKLGNKREQYLDLYFTYTLDLRINYGEIDEKGNPILDEDGNPIGKELPMGEPGTSWYYVVPFVGQKITRFEEGKWVERAATEDDCRVYPNRRLQISCTEALMYDGPAFDWHGMVPIIPFYLDEWAWEESGFSLFQSTMNTQDAIDDLMRFVYRVAMARSNPGRVYNTDITTGDKGGKLTSRQAESLDPFDPGITWGVDGDVKESVLRPPLPEWCYNVPPWVMEIVQFLQGCIQKELGHDQIQALEKMKANISDPEKLLDAEGPTVMGSSRSMERSFRDMAKIVLSLIVQYMPVGTIMDYVGADGIAPSTFDFEPYSLVPSHLPGEPTVDAMGNPVLSVAKPGERAQYFLKNLRVSVTPHSMHYIAQAKKRIEILALLGKGVPVDPETLATEFNLSNWGTIEGSTIKEKVVNWAKEQVLEKAQIMKLEEAEGLLPPPGAEPAKPGPKPGAPGSGRPPVHPGEGKAKQKGAASGGRVVVSTTKG